MKFCSCVYLYRAAGTRHNQLQLFSSDVSRQTNVPSFCKIYKNKEYSKCIYLIGSQGLKDGCFAKWFPIGMTNWCNKNKIPSVGVSFWGNFKDTLWNLQNMCLKWRILAYRIECNDRYRKTSRWLNALRSVTDPDPLLSTPQLWVN